MLKGWSDLFPQVPLKSAVDEWVTAALVKEGRLFRCVSRKGSAWGDGITEKVIWHAVKSAEADTARPALGDSGATGRNFIS
jgi:hypothetical protein